MPNPELIAECRKHLEENLDRSYSQDSETINAIAAHFAAKIEEAKREGYNDALEEAAIIANKHAIIWLNGVEFNGHEQSDLVIRDDLRASTASEIESEILAMKKETE